MNDDVTLRTCRCGTVSHARPCFPVRAVVRLIQQSLTFLGVFYVAVLRRTDEPNQQLLPGRVQVRHHDVVGGELHSAAFLDLTDHSSRVRIALVV